MGWVSILILLVRFAINLPDIVAVIKEIWDLISNLPSRKERRARKAELVDVIKKHGGHCVKIRDEGQLAAATDDLKCELETMKEGLLKQASSQPKKEE